MATQTTNLNLTKPDMTDWADIRVINNNWDILDRIFGGTVGDVDKSSTGIVVTKQDNTTKAIDFITNSYTDIDTTKLLTLSTLKQYLGEGAIVSSKIDTVGYIKFKNGLIIQWGLNWFEGSATYVNLNLPIPSQVFMAVATDDVGSVTTQADKFIINWNSGYSANNTTTIRFLGSRIAGGNIGNFTWLCVGKEV